MEAGNKKHSITCFKEQQLEFIRAYAETVAVDGETYYFLPILKKLKDDIPLVPEKERGCFIQCNFSQLPDGVISAYILDQMRRQGLDMSFMGRPAIIKPSDNNK